MAKEAEKRLIRTLEFLKEPQGSTIPTLVKTLNNDKPQISLKRIVQTLRGCQQNGTVKVLDGRVRLRQNALENMIQECKDKEISEQVMKSKTKRNNGKGSILNKLGENHSKHIGTKSNMSKNLSDGSGGIRIVEFDDDEPPPENPDGEPPDPCQKKPKPKCPKKKPRCPKKKPKCPKKKPKCPKKKPKCPKKKPRCPKPKPKCPKPKPKCPKPKPKC